MFITLHILVSHYNVVGWHHVLIYSRTPRTNYYLESSGREAYMKLTLSAHTLYSLTPTNLLSYLLTYTLPILVGASHQ
jgi:hypothetical protein